MSNSEQYEMLCSILASLVDVLNCDELSLLAYHCGASVEDFYGTTPQDDDLFKDQLKIAA